MCTIPTFSDEEKHPISGLSVVMCLFNETFERGAYNLCTSGMPNWFYKGVRDCCAPIPQQKTHYQWPNELTNLPLSLRIDVSVRMDSSFNVNTV